MKQFKTLDPVSQNKILEKYVTGHIAFIVAMIAIILNNRISLSYVDIIVSLLFLSLPFLVAMLIIDYRIRVMQRREKSATRGLVSFLGFLLSITGIVLLIANFSKIAAVLFIIICLLLLFWVHELSVLGYEKDSSI